ncbi:MAG TPA: sugar ABC transporter substrate-binding protein, partial [Chloroflexi bacterium]|nr:sugar ABC transporter substrate-binding protein [Chloroflexota bacterium]
GATEAPAAATEAPAAATGEPVSLVLWTQEGEAEGTFAWVQDLAQRYSKDHPNVSIEVDNYSTEDLRTQFQQGAIAGQSADFLWTVNDHAGPFTAAGLIQPVDDLLDLSPFVDNALAAVELDGKHWGIPISNGNHLMLLCNKKIVDTPPADTDELIAKGKEWTTGDQYGLVYNLVEPFWLAPWWGGYGMKNVFKEGTTQPDLNNEAMVNALQFVHDLKFKEKIVPESADYNAADSLFKEGKAACIINGDWSLGGYVDAGLDFTVSRIPKLTATGEWPHPYTSGKYFMFNKDLSGARLNAAIDFAKFVTSQDIQLEMADKFRRLPALKTALDAPQIKSDPILSGSADQMVVGIPMPTVPEMRCVWDGVRPQLEGVMADSITPQNAAGEAQNSAEVCVKDIGTGGGD